MTLNSKNEEFLIKDKKVHGLENIFLIFIKNHLHQKLGSRNYFDIQIKIGLPCFTSVFNHEAVDFLEKLEIQPIRYRHLKLIIFL